MGPKGKSPWIEYNGVRMGDTEMILSYLAEKCGAEFNKGMTSEQKGVASAFQKLVDEHMYW